MRVLQLDASVKRYPLQHQMVTRKEWDRHAAVAMVVLDMKDASKRVAMDVRRYMLQHY